MTRPLKAAAQRSGPCSAKELKIMPPKTRKMVFIENAKMLILHSFYDKKVRSQMTNASAKMNLFFYIIREIFDFRVPVRAKGDVLSLASSAHGGPTARSRRAQVQLQRPIDHRAGVPSPLELASRATPPLDRAQPSHHHRPSVKRRNKSSSGILLPERNGNGTPTLIT